MRTIHETLVMNWKSIFSLTHCQTLYNAKHLFWHIIMYGNAAACNIYTSWCFKKLPPSLSYEWNHNRTSMLFDNKDMVWFQTDQHVTKSKTVIICTATVTHYHHHPQGHSRSCSSLVWLSQIWQTVYIYSVCYYNYIEHLHRGDARQSIFKAISSSIAVSFTSTFWWAR